MSRYPDKLIDHFINTKGMSTLRKCAFRYGKQIRRGQYFMPKMEYWFLDKINNCCLTEFSLHQQNFRVQYCLTITKERNKYILIAQLVLKSQIPATQDFNILAKREYGLTQHLKKSLNNITPWDIELNFDDLFKSVIEPFEKLRKHYAFIGPM